MRCAQEKADEILYELISKLEAQLEFIKLDDHDSAAKVGDEIALLTAEAVRDDLLNDRRFAERRKEIDTLSRRACVCAAAKRQELARELEKIRRGLKYINLSSTKAR